MESPELAYRRLLLENEVQLAREQKRDTWFGYAKLAILLAGAIAALALLHPPDRLALLLIPAALFVVLAVAHERVLRSLRDRKRVIEFYDGGISRLEDRWAGRGDRGDRFLDPAHPYARDLDVFGEGSLFELLCTVRTRAGEETLARWLLNAAPPEEVRGRQAAIMEMKDRLHFREKLFVAGESMRLGVRSETLSAWGERERIFSSRWLAPSLATLAILWVATGVYVLAAHSCLPLFLLVSMVNFGISYGLRRPVDESVKAVEKAALDLKVLSKVLKILEQETFESERLRDLRVSLNTGRVPPSAAMKKLDRIVEWLESRRNVLIGQFSPFVFYTVGLTLAAESWRQSFGPAIRGWLSTVGEFEALSALAGYAWEHPADVLISGPNMAGKSTFLRGVGINAVLAQCGAPVRAKKLRLSPLAVGASICVLDSLQGGVSRFYAEIKRLKLLSDLAQGPVALLFLLDELLSGTNSNDRFDGTRYVVRALVRRGAIGMVTTHDLALTRIPATMNEPAQNCHFADSFQDGELKFDYRLHPGIVQTSNALKLMQIAGLEIEEQAE